jgi:hypothetical protein
MTKKIKVKVVRRDPIDANKLASALVEIAVRVVKQPKESVPTQDTNAHE